MSKIKQAMRPRARPLAVGKSLTDSLFDQMCSRVSPASTSNSLHAPTGQTVESGFSPDGGAETLVLKVIGSARTSIPACWLPVNFAKGGSRAARRETTWRRCRGCRQ
jgi:hypothetical protein